MARLKVPGPRRRLLVVIGVFSALLAIEALRSEDRRVAAPSKVAAARSLLVRVDQAEQCFWKRFGRYSANVADLQVNLARVRPQLADLSGINSFASVHRLQLMLAVDRDGTSYVQRVTGEDIDTVVERRGTGFVDYGDYGFGHLRERCP